MSPSRDPKFEIARDAGQIDIGRDAGQIDIGRDAGQIDIGRDAGQIDIARDADASSGHGLGRVKDSLAFLERATRGDGLRARLEAASGHEEVISLAKEQGYEITRESLAEAMKIFVDRSLETTGVPSWVRARIVAPVHD
jgi:predicted ribosomally synthesized peptide with nif11-like leader